MSRGTEANSLKINREKMRDYTVSFEHEQLLGKGTFGCPIKTVIFTFSTLHVNVQT